MCLTFGIGLRKEISPWTEAGLEGTCEELLEDSQGHWSMQVSMEFQEKGHGPILSTLKGAWANAMFLDVPAQFESISHCSF